MTLTPHEWEAFQEALADGVFRDVTELAESLDFHADIFVSVGYWSTPPISRTEDGLKAALLELVDLFEHGLGTKGDELNGKVLWSYPYGLKPGNELANVFRLWRTEDQRLHLIILARGESLDFRIKRTASGGSLYTQ